MAEIDDLAFETVVLGEGERVHLNAFPSVRSSVHEYNSANSCDSARQEKP